MVAPPRPEAITVEEAVRRYLRACEGRVSVGSISPRTLENYSSDLREFSAHVGPQVILDDITGEQVDAAVQAFGSAPDRRYGDPANKSGPGKAVSTQVRFWRSVAQFFRHAERQAWVQVSPMTWASLKPRSRGGLRTARTALSFEQASALLRHGAGDPGVKGRSHEMNHERDTFIIMALLVLGLRVSEVVHADVDDFRWVEGSEVWRVTGKGGEVRHLPLSARLSSTKRAYLEKRPDVAAGPGAKALVRTGRGGRMTSRDVQRLLHRAYQRVRVAEPEHAREITPHALRHTAATIMLASGWDVKVVSKMLGHSSVAITSTYLDELPGELAEAVSRNPLLET